MTDCVETERCDVTRAGFEVAADTDDDDDHHHQMMMRYQKLNNFVYRRYRCLLTSPKGFNVKRVYIQGAKC